MKNQLAKQKDHAFGKDVFLLGSDEDGTKYWLESPKWDCDWYWGFGYVETYRHNSVPSKAKDINSHSHIDSSFIGSQEVYNFEKQCFVKGDYIHNIYDSLKFIKTTFTENEGWTLSELFKSFYILKETAEFYKSGSAGATTNPLSALLECKAEQNRINEILIPAITAKIIEILSPA